MSTTELMEAKHVPIPVVPVAVAADRLGCNAYQINKLGLSHVVSPIADSVSRNSSGDCLRNSPKLDSGNFKPSRPYGV